MSWVYFGGMLVVCVLSDKLLGLIGGLFGEEDPVDACAKQKKSVSGSCESSDEEDSDPDFVAYEMKPKKEAA